MSDPVIVGTDGSAHAALAVSWAAEDAALRGRPLHIVHVTERWAQDIPFFPPPGMAESLSRAGLDILAGAEQIAHAHRPDLTITTELMADRTVEALQDLSRRGFEIVLGHRGLGDFAALLLGSTGLRLVSHAAGPVVIVRGGGGGGGGRGGRTELPATDADVVVGADLSEASVAALDYAFDAARTRGARLRAVHGWQLAETLIAAGYATDLEEVDTSARRGVTEALTPWRARHPDVDVTEEVVRGHPVTALVDASAGAGLVVVGAHGHGGVRGAKIGSVSHGVLHHAHCPVAVVRPRG